MVADLFVCLLGSLQLYWFRLTFIGCVTKAKANLHFVDDTDVVIDFQEVLEKTTKHVCLVFVLPTVQSPAVNASCCSCRALT